MAKPDALAHWNALYSAWKGAHTEGRVARAAVTEVLRSGMKPHEDEFEAVEALERLADELSDRLDRLVSTWFG
ncbi:MAG: hypothetical protein JSR59_00940 [Proteobacteria bacterium]|nr:hypothetical protein [Pseudomonadota bacterium]